ncbi:MAG: sodium:solute symporter family protein, partial [Pseudomonadota bacterium]
HSSTSAFVWSAIGGAVSTSVWAIVFGEPLGIPALVIGVLVNLIVFVSLSSRAPQRVIDTR